MSVSQVPSKVGSEAKPDPRRGRGRRWLVRLGDIVAVLSVAYGFGDYVWTLAHPSAATTPSSGLGLDLVIWLFNLPLFLAGLLWLMGRWSFAYGAGYLKFEKEHPVRSRAAAFLIIVVGWIVLGLAIWLCGML